MHTHGLRAYDILVNMTGEKWAFYFVRIKCYELYSFI